MEDFLSQDRTPRRLNLTGIKYDGYRQGSYQFVEQDFSKSKFRDAYFSKVYFLSCNFKQCDFSFANFQACTFTDCTFDNTIWTGTNVNACFFHDCSTINLDTVDPKYPPKFNNNNFETPESKFPVFKTDIDDDRCRGIIMHNIIKDATPIEAGFENVNISFERNEEMPKIKKQ